eukprot:s1568_g4.t1
MHPSFSDVFSNASSELPCFVSDPTQVEYQFEHEPALAQFAVNVLREEDNMPLQPIPSPNEQEEQELQQLSPQQRKLLSQEIDKAHKGMGHPNHDRFLRILKLGGASNATLALAKMYSCSQCRENKRPKPWRRAAPPRELQFNEVVGIDTFTVKHFDHSIKCLNIICWGTRYQMVVPLQGERAADARAAYRQWIKLFGPPRVLKPDLGTEFLRDFLYRCSTDGTEVDPSSLESPTQNSITEREGKAFFSAECSAAIRRAIASGPRSTEPFEVGQLVYFWSRGQFNKVGVHHSATRRPNHAFWNGPCRVIATQYPSSIYIAFQGRLIKASPEQCRRASDDEDASCSELLKRLCNVRDFIRDDKVTGVSDIRGEPFPDFDHPTGRKRNYGKQPPVVRPKVPRLSPPEVAAVPDVPDEISEGYPSPSLMEDSNDDTVAIDSDQELLLEIETEENPIEAWHGTSVQTGDDVNKRAARELKLKDLNEHDAQLFKQAISKEWTTNIDNGAIKVLDPLESQRIRQTMPNRVMQSRLLHVAKPLDDPSQVEPHQVLNCSPEGVPCKAKSSVSLLMQAFPKPTIADLKTCNRILKEAMLYKDLDICIRPIEPQKLCIVVSSDAAWANAKDQDGEHKSQAGYVVLAADRDMLQGHEASFSMIGWKSHTLKRRTVSTLSAETQGIVESAAVACWYRYLLAELFYRNLIQQGGIDWETMIEPLEFGVVTDAKSVYDSLTCARVFFVSVGSTRGTPLEPYTVHVPGDLEVGYKRLPVRILKIWHYFSEDDWSCDWVMKADSDTYVNLRAVSDRLKCFDSAEEHFFGAVHAIVPPRHLREMWSALYFAHGGSGYMVSRGLLPKLRASAPACLEDMLEMTSGDAMEDVIFALCLQRQLDIQVKSYGFLKPMTHRHLLDPAAEPELATQEIVVNFHQARDELLDRRRAPGEPLQRFIHWDAQPPPLHGCIMVAHPVENETDLHEVHALISRAALAQHHALALLEGDVMTDLEAAEQLREGSRAGHGRCVHVAPDSCFMTKILSSTLGTAVKFGVSRSALPLCRGAATVPGMATLGYRDSGSVVLSKAEALRQAHEKEGERSRLMTWSKRKSPPRTTRSWGGSPKSSSRHG